VSVLCPYCKYTIPLQNVPPGRFEPKCARCGRAFALVVSADIPPQVQASPLAGIPAAAAVVASPEIAVGVAPQTLANYQIIRPLGKLNEGAVYLARQITLDRPVVLRVINPQWAQNPAILARFMREAYAASQLAYHHLVRVLDLGSDRGLHYVCTEYVEGQTLGQLQKSRGKLPAEEAAIYILKAARGLQFAHARGMIHRNVKPDNIIVNQQSMAKVADLGLASRPTLEEVPPGQSVGTPGYMAPEQVRDAQVADPRSDVYSLGYTLYEMVTGRPVFKGNTVEEVLARNNAAPGNRPGAVIDGVPRALSDIIVKMTAAKLGDRYASMADVIRALEDFLHIEGAGRLAQSKDCVRTLERGFHAFQLAGPIALKTPVLLSFFCGCAALFAFLLLIRQWKIAGCILAVALLTAVAHFVVHGLTHRTYLFQRFRDMALSRSWRDLLKPGVALLLFCVVLWAFGQLLLWMLAGLLAVFLVVGFHYVVDRRIAAARAAALAEVEDMLKTLRLRGVSEEALQEFVCKTTGSEWEEFFEALFGYEAKLAARLAFAGGTAALQPRFGAWRDPLVRWLDRFQKSRQEARLQQYLQEIEQANLLAQGIAAARAREEAERAAGVRKEEQPAAPAAPTAVTTAPEAGAGSSIPSRPIPSRPIVVQEIFQPRPHPTSTPRSSFLADVFEALVGSGVRFVVGATLLGTSLWWLHTRGLLPGRAELNQEWAWRQLWEKGQQVPPLTIAGVPEIVLQAVCSLGAAIAGLALILSANWRSPKIGVLTLLGAAVMVAGPVSGLVSAVEGVSPFVLCLIAGGGIMVLGFLFGRDM
jgi:hypothetical protein